MRSRALIVVLVGACSDTAPSMPDASVRTITAECHTVVVTGDEPFATALDFGPIVPGSLAGWDPDGRWFFAGVRVGRQSSVHFQRDGSHVIVDRDPQSPGTLDDDVLFQRSVSTTVGQRSVIATRVSDRASDGTLRADRAECGDAQCVVCTAELIRAAHNGDEGEGSNLTLVGQLHDPSWEAAVTANVRVLGTTAYLIRSDGLHTIDVADPAHPVQLGHYRKTQLVYANDVKLVQANNKRYAFIADVPVDIVDVTNPAMPKLVASIARAAHTLTVESRGDKTYAYLGAYDATVPVYDVTDPEHPVALGSYQTSGAYAHDLSVDAGIAYINAWDAGFLAVDFTTPSTPVLLGSWTRTTAQNSHSNGTTTVAGRHIALHGDEGYGAHLDVLDVDPSSATFMTSLASYKTRDFVSIHNIMAFGAKAYFAYYQDGIRVLDLSDPAAPALVGYYNTWDPQADYTTSAQFEGALGLDVDLARRLVFVADSPRGLLILQDTTP
jgi:hypothetical protein